MATTVHTRSDKEINAQIKRSVSDLLAAGTALGLADLKGRPHKVTFRCPLHGGCSAGATLKEDGPVWHCFGCDEGGDYFSLVEAATGLGDWGEVRERGAMIAGVTLPPRHTPDDGLPIVPVELLVRQEDLVWLDALLARAAGTDLLGADDLVEAAAALEPVQEVDELAQEAAELAQGVADLAQEVDDLAQEVDDLAQEVDDELAQVDATEPASAPPAPPAREAEYAQLWAHCLRLDDPAVPPEAIDYLRGRALPPGELLDLARVLPQDGPLPSWAACEGMPWTTSRHLVIVRIFDAAGRLAGLRARSIDPSCASGKKELVAGGVKVAGTVLADGPAETVIRLGPEKVAAALRQTGRKLVVMVAEGVPDWLTLSAWARRWRATSASAGAMLAVVGTYSGGWTQALADRLPHGTRVVVRTHSDEGGCKYRDAISDTLWARRCLVEVRHPDGIPTARKHPDENDDLRLLGIDGIDPLAGNTARPAPPRGGWPLTDLGNAERLVHRHGADLRYCTSTGRWLAWDGARWCAEDQLVVERRAAAAARAIRAVEAERIKDPDARKVVESWALKSESDKMISATVRRARALQEVAVRPDALDADPMLLGCANGVVDLSRGVLIRSARSLLITRTVSVAYDPKAQCPRWLRFLREVFDGDRAVIEFLRQYVGYCLTGSQAEQSILIMHGAAACNGKSTLLGVLLTLLGSYAHSPEHTLISAERARGAHTTDRAAMRGRRLTVIDEWPEGVGIDGAALKALTGAKMVSAREMHQRAADADFRPTSKIVIACNRIPQLFGDDSGVWRRVYLLPFAVSFKGREDLTLEDSLTEELPGILAWAVAGAKAWSDAGALKPCVPAAVRAATSAAREDADLVALWIEARLEAGTGYSISPTEAAASWVEWASSQRLPAKDAKRFSLKTIGAALEAKGYARGHTRTGTVIEGLRLRAPVGATIVSEAEREAEAAETAAALAALK